jgi:hypothetical protein
MDEDEVLLKSFQNEQKEEKLSAEQIAQKRKEIKKEKNKLSKIFKKIDTNTFNIAQNLIDEAAFMSVTLKENREYIEEYGVKEFYMNGKGQFGYKESVESKNYNAMIKNYSNVIKQLIDFLPKEEKKSAGEDLLQFIASGKK